MTPQLHNTYRLTSVATVRPKTNPDARLNQLSEPRQILLKMWLLKNLSFLTYSWK